jgi:putative FmdB family regulatory protein
MIYPYRCPEHGPFEVSKRMADASRPEPCPVCGMVQPDQDFQAKDLAGFLSTEGDWSGGKFVPQLPANHPDSMVTSKGQMEKVYRKHGINMDTGKFESKEAQIRATVPAHKRTGQQTTAIGGVDD